jgi:AcrR family transcriptional regulator
MKRVAPKTKAGNGQAERSSATQERLLDVAEQLFARRGLDAVSVRDITQAAGESLGAITYHFGTMRNLMVAVFDRRMAPLTRQRLEALDAVEKAAADGPLPLEAVLEAMFRPAVMEAMTGERAGIVFGKLMARSMMDPNPNLETYIRGHIEPVIRRFDAALMRAMPELTPADVFWRMHLLVGGLHQSLLMMDRKPPGDAPPLRLDAETYLRRFVAFAAAVFRAQLPKM